jgi:hypothetical protein
MNTVKLVVLTAIAAALAACSDSAPGKIYLRVAHLSPDAPAVDLCIKQGSGSFTGPVLKGLGAASGLAYPQVTKYLELDEGQYTARLVAPNAADCTASLAGLPDYALPALSAGTYATAAAVGLVAANPMTFTVKPLVDNHTVATGKASIRFVHASPGTPAVDVGVGSGANFTAIFSNVAFAGIATGTGIDANGYFETAPLSNVTVSARAHGGTTDALIVPGVSLDAGQVATAFAIGQLSSATKPLKALVCVDNAAPTGLLSTCLAPLP